MNIPPSAFRFTTALLLAFVWMGIALSAQAEDRLAQIFQDNMVLQREKPVPVWGWANPGAQVEVSFEGQKKQAKADEKGYWKAILDPLKANRTGQVLTMKIGATTMSRNNVLVGEVWLAAGQSNMVHEGPDIDSGVYPHYVSPGTKGGKPEIRICPYGWGASLEPLEDIDPAGRGSAPWQVLQEDPPLAAMGLSYYFSRVVRDGLDVPVGIILVAIPGTNLSAWTSRETLEEFPSRDGKQGNIYQEFLAQNEARLAKSGGAIKSWAAMQQAETAWRETKKGRSPSNSGLIFVNYPTALYNTRIHPLAPFALRGAIWHQQSDSGERLVAMVKQWRKLFGQDFHFVWSTMSRSTTEPPPLSPLRSEFYRSYENTQIRLALKLFGGDRHVAMVEDYDLGDEGTHYIQKNEAGRRMGLAALTVAYGQNHLYSGPRITEAKIEGNKAIIRFELFGDGMVYQPSINGISGVYLRGKTGPGQWGQVKILSKDRVEFSHPDIADLETVAYANNSNPHETLFNSAGLPASPFVVNPARNADPQPPFELVSLAGEKEGKSRKPGKDVMISLCHVRRSGYVFQMVGKEKEDPGLEAKPVAKEDHGKNGAASVSVQAYIPAEWKGFEVEAGGKRLEVTETTKDGIHLVIFNAPMDRSWVIVAEAGKAAEFRKVNRL